MEKIVERPFRVLHIQNNQISIFYEKQLNFNILQS